MITKMIYTNEEYQHSLKRLEALMDAAPGSSEEEELDLLSFLVDKYEQEHFPIDLPDPVEAIKFRMDQQGLTRKDLVPYIGSQSKVSEVLNRKRPLSLAMIRELHKGLGIPAEVLLQEPGKHLDEPQFNPQDYPLQEMVKAGYFPGVSSVRKAREQAEELLEQLLSSLKGLDETLVYCRNTTFEPNIREVDLAVANGHIDYGDLTEDQTKANKNGQGKAREMNEKALRAWQARVIQICDGQKLPKQKNETITRDFIRNLVRLSAFANGPLLARQVLLDNGIHFVILPHLPQTYLDGACFKATDGRIVIGMTLRYDREDYFWFTLVHELAHALLHLDNNNFAFFDDTDHSLSHACSQQEQEANELSMSLLIPDEIWESKKGELIASMREDNIINFAEDLGISPAIVAGRLRWELKDYSIFPSLLESNTVRKIFASSNELLG